MVWFTKVCSDCGEEFQTTSERFVLCRKCRRKPEHQSAASKHYYEMVRSPEAPLLDGRKKARCLNCGNEYWQVVRSQKFCSEDCHGKWQTRNAKQTCRTCGRTTHTKSGYCKACKPNPCNKELRTTEVLHKECPRCKNEFETVNKYKVYCSERCAKASKDARRCKKRKKDNPPAVCARCGNEFVPSRSGNIYCSPKCNNAHNAKHLRHRLRKYGTKERDYGITINALMKRHNGRCHICGGKVNKNDCSRDERGYFVTGGDYPTIDHILPLSKGGGHTWNNVALAHQRCNSIKSDNPNFETDTGQMKFAI